MLGCFYFASDGVFKDDDAARGGEAKEGAGGGVGRVDLVFANTWLFYRDMASEYSEMSEVRHSICVSIEWSDAAWE